MIRAIIVAVALLFSGCSPSALPPKQDLIALSGAELKQLMLDHAAVGSSRGQVERVLREDFRRDWSAIDYEAVSLMEKKGFAEPVSPGDYYLRSNIAVVRRTAFASDVVTIYLLFDREGRLKDVAARKWTDSL